jgi:hypothetical protein
MLGLLAIIAVQFAVLGVCSYWISWDMQHKDRRPAFIRQVCNDLLDFMSKRTGSDRIRVSRSVAAKRGRVKTENHRSTPTMT